MVDTLKYFLSRPITIIIIVAVAVLSVVAFGVSNAVCQSETKLVSSLDLDTVERDSDSGKLVAKLVDYEEKQKSNYQTITSKLETAANPEKEITDKADKYINTRYNFDNGVSSIKDKLQQEMKSYATPEFINYVNSSLDKDKTTSREAKILKRFISGRKMEDINASSNVLTYMYVVDINGQQDLIQYTFKLNSGEWMLSSEQVLKTLQGAEKYE